MALRKILSTDIERVVRAMEVDNATPEATGQQIDAMVVSLVSGIRNSKGRLYKIENDGVLWGYYVTVKSNTNYLLDHIVLRKTILFVDEVINQVQEWITQELPALI